MYCLALPRFFHSVSAVLWWGVDELRNLVILAPEWVMDAASTFMRDFSMQDG